jgi:uncharacterized protein
VAKIKVFRDPIHTNISFHLEPSSGPGNLILRLIDTPQVQRLRHVRQLALANTVYHGAEHSRFSHTLGVVHLARRMYELAKAHTDHQVQVEELSVVAAAAVLHDIGHPPFSHAVERVLGVNHEHLTVRLLQDSTEVHRILREYGGDEFIQKVGGHIDGSLKVPTTGMISSQLDADRLDYVLRDGYYAGVPNSRYDLERILQMILLDNHGLVFDERAVYAIEGYFTARYHLYLQLYYHKTNRAAEVVLRGILNRAKFLQNQGRSLGQINSTVLKMFSDQASDAAVHLNDHDLWSTFRIWTSHDDVILRDLSHRLLNRKYFKAVDLSDEHLNEFYQQQKPHIDEIARQKGFDPQYYVIADPAKDTPYKIVDPTSGDDPSSSVRIRSSTGKLYSLERKSKLIQTLQSDAYQRVRLCFPEDIREDVNRIISK